MSAQPKRTKLINATITISFFAICLGLLFVFKGAKSRESNVRSACYSETRKISPEREATSKFCSEVMEKHICSDPTKTWQMARNGSLFSSVDCASALKRYSAFTRYLIVTSLEAPSIWFREDGAKKAFYRQLSTQLKRPINQPELSALLKSSGSYVRTRPLTDAELEAQLRDEMQMSNELMRHFKEEPIGPAKQLSEFREEARKRLERQKEEQKN